MEICMEVSRKQGQYWAPSYFPYISSSTHRILDKFGIYAKLSSRTIQRYLGRGDRTRTHEERGKLLVLIIRFSVISDGVWGVLEVKEWVSLVGLQGTGFLWSENHFVG